MVKRKAVKIGIGPGEKRRWRGDADKVSPRGLPISREELQSVLATSSSLRAAAGKLNINHQVLMDVIRFDEFYKRLVEDAEERYAFHWPKSATERELMEYGWIHTLLNRRCKDILAERRFGKGSPLADKRRNLSESLKELRTKLKFMRKKHSPEVSKLEESVDRVTQQINQIDLNLWPSSEELCRLFMSTYPPDRWESLTRRRKLLLQAGIPGELRDQVFVDLSTISGAGSS